YEPGGAGVADECAAARGDASGDCAVCWDEHVCGEQPFGHYRGDAAGCERGCAADSGHGCEWVQRYAGVGRGAGHGGVLLLACGEYGRGGAGSAHVGGAGAWLGYELCAECGGGYDADIDARADCGVWAGGGEWGYYEYAELHGV